MAVTPVYRSPDHWAEKVDPVYEALSAALVASSPVSLAGRIVVDLGAGTGATSRAIAAAGGRPLELDLSYPMLNHRRTGRSPAILTDITALPVATGSVEGAVAAFSLSHIEDPSAVLAEATRVTHIGGPVLAGVFAAAGTRHPAKTVVEDLVSHLGWEPPPWYLRLKEHLEPRLADPGELARLAAEAGLGDITVIDQQVDAGLTTAQALVDWRLGNPALAPFVDSLSPAASAALEADAVAEVGRDLQPLRLTVRMLSSIVRATR